MRHWDLRRYEIQRAKTKLELENESEWPWWGLVTLCLFLCTGLTGIYIWVLG